MTTKQLIQAEIDALGEEDLGELYGIVKRFTASKSADNGRGILEKLRNIQIEAPPDFAENLHLYRSGEKRVGDDLH